LVCPLRLVAPTAFSYYLLCLPEVVDHPKIALFRRIMISEAAATEASILAIDRPFLLSSNTDRELPTAA
jgi:hypothetical protein